MQPSAPTPHQTARELRELPVPSTEAQAHSSCLSDLIRAEIETAGGAIPFVRFMELALHAPGLGYYSAGSQKLGEAGDFVTAPELTPLFARTLARQCREVLGNLGGGDILEYGPGSGALAVDLMLELERLDCLPHSYYLLEISADLRERQAAAFGERAPHLLERVEWLDSPPAGLQGVVLANEVLDAMPVHRFRVTREGPRELRVAAEAGGFTEHTGSFSNADVAQRISSMVAELSLVEGYESELNLAGEAWIASLGGVLARGVALLIDYGFPRSEYYHPQRTGGTLMCHYRHRAHDNPLILPGLQDITAHVDFTAMAEAAVAAGLAVRGFTNQASFLLANGLTELVTEDGSVAEQLTQANAIKRLTLPGEMGELFKVLALARDYDEPLRGFVLRDDRVRL